MEIGHSHGKGQDVRALVGVIGLPRESPLPSNVSVIDNSS